LREDLELICRVESRKGLHTQISDKTRAEVGNYDIDFLNFCHHQVQKFQNFEPVKMRPKFWGKLSKSSKDKVN